MILWAYPREFKINQVQAKIQRIKIDLPILITVQWFIGLLKVM